MFFPFYFLTFPPGYQVFVSLWPPADNLGAGPRSCAHGPESGLPSDPCDPAQPQNVPPPNQKSKTWLLFLTNATNSTGLFLIIFSRFRANLFEPFIFVSSFSPSFFSRFFWVPMFPKNCGTKKIEAYEFVNAVKLFRFCLQLSREAFEYKCPRFQICFYAYFLGATKGVEKIWTKKYGTKIYYFSKKLSKEQNTWKIVKNQFWKIGFMFCNLAKQGSRVF